MPVLLGSEARAAKSLSVIDLRSPATLDETFGRVRVPGCRRLIQCGAAGDVRDSKVYTLVKEQLNHSTISLSGSDVQRCVTMFGCHIRSRALLKELIGEVFVPASGSKMKRRLAGLIGRVGIGAMLQQDYYKANVSGCRCSMQQSIAAFSDPLIWIGSVCDEDTSNVVLFKSFGLFKDAGTIEITAMNVRSATKCRVYFTDSSFLDCFKQLIVW
jgi:hypothetical protein